MQRWLIAGVFILLSFVPAQAKIDLTGSIRNDAILLETASGTQFNNILENQLVFQRKAEQWKFYSDVRFYLYYGDAASQLEDALSDLPIAIDYMTAKLLRIYVRWYSPVGDFSLGKTYVPFGTMSVFNPFEIDRQVNITDLNYTKDGIVALTYDLPLDAVSGVRAYLSPEASESDASAGLDVFTNVGNFDLGAVVNRSGKDDNVAGVHFKGDLELGVQGSLATHFNDVTDRTHTEATLGCDYSFAEGKWLVGALAYYHDVEAAAEGNTLAGAAQLSTTAFPDKFYLYGNIAYVPDEFFQMRLDAFVNLDDASSLLVPTATWVLANGLNLSLIGMLPTGVGDTQYSRDTYGYVAGVVRVEAKL